MPRLLFCFFIFISSFSLQATSVSFSSPESRVNLLELYTSEGCSSCPPAERYVSDLKNDERLWTELIPIAFHVDYWNYLGWEDRFSDAAYSQRQRNYARQKNLRTVYTPGFLLNGEEWRSFFGLRKLGLANDKPGKLTLELDDLNVALSYFGDVDSNTNYVAHVALIGFDVSTRVKSGENHGRLLEHDFIVLSHAKEAMKNNTEKRTATLKLPIAIENVASMGVVAWINKVGDLSPVQAVGGKLP